MGVLEAFRPMQGGAHSFPTDGNLILSPHVFKNLRCIRNAARRFKYPDKADAALHVGNLMAIYGALVSGAGSSRSSIPTSRRGRSPNCAEWLQLEGALALWRLGMAPVGTHADRLYASESRRAADREISAPKDARGPALSPLSEIRSKRRPIGRGVIIATATRLRGEARRPAYRNSVSREFSLIRGAMRLNSTGYRKSSAYWVLYLSR